MVPFEDVLSSGSSVPSLFLIGFNLPSLLRQSRQRAATKRRGGRRAPEGFRAGPEPPLYCGRARAAAELPPLNSPPRIAAPKPRGVRLKPRCRCGSGGRCWIRCSRAARRWRRRASLCRMTGRRKKRPSRPWRERNALARRYAGRITRPRTLTRR